MVLIFALIFVISGEYHFESWSDFNFCLQEKIDDSWRLLNPDCNGRPLGSEKVQIS